MNENEMSLIGLKLSVQKPVRGLTGYLMHLWSRQIVSVDRPSFSLTSTTLPNGTKVGCTPL